MTVVRNDETITFLGRVAITRMVEGSARLAAIDKAVASGGWKIVG